MNTNPGEMMDAKEALKKIDEIHGVIASSNRALFSGERMMLIGAMVTLIPLIEKATQYMTFGQDFGPHAALIVTLIHTVFYWGLFSLVGRRMPFKKLDRSELHPMIRKAFSISKPFMASVIGVIFVFTLIDQARLIYPVIFLLLGLLYTIYGKFSVPAVTYIAWSYVAAGLLYAYLTQFHSDETWVYFTVYNGLSYIGMGYFLRKETDPAAKQGALA